MQNKRKNMVNNNGSYTGIRVFLILLFILFSVIAIRIYLETNILSTPLILYYYTSAIPVLGFIVLFIKEDKQSKMSANKLYIKNVEKARKKEYGYKGIVATPWFIIYIIGLIGVSLLIKNYNNKADIIFIKSLVPPIFFIVLYLIYVKIIFYITYKKIRKKEYNIENNREYN